MARSSSARIRPSGILISAGADSRRCSSLTALKGWAFIGAESLLFVLAVVAADLVFGLAERVTRLLRNTSDTRPTTDFIADTDTPRARF